MTNKSRKDKVIEAGIKLFSEKGYHNTTVSEIAKKANVGKGTVYWHFDSKKDLFESIIMFSLKKLMDSVKRRVEEEKDTINKLKIITELTLNFFIESQQLAKMQQESTFSLDRDFKEKIFDFRNQKIAYIKVIIEEGKEEGSFNSTVDSDELANILLGMVASYRPEIYRINFSARDKAELIMDTLINGIKA